MHMHRFALPGRARRAGLAGLSTLLAVVAGCRSNVGTPCAVSAECDAGEICIDGACSDALDANLATVGEGEGEGEPIGEGEPAGEGEGEPAGAGEGEGEGEPSGEGEGEPVGEGEGEPSGEGEGEGEACGAPCGPYQQCVAGACSFVGELCDTFAGEAGTVGGYATASGVVLGPTGGSVRFDGFLPAQAADTYFYNVDRVLTEAMTSLPQLKADPTPPLPAELTVEMDAVDFDPYLAVVRGDTCTVLAENDDATMGDTRASALRVDLRDVDAGTHVVATSFFGETTGTYALRLRPTLCGLETDSLATWNQCVRAMATQNADCTRNPCARDANNNLTGQYCCLQGNCGRTGDEPIVLLDDATTCN